MIIALLFLLVVAGLIWAAQCLDRIPKEPVCERMPLADWMAEFRPEPSSRSLAPLPRVEPIALPPWADKS